MIRDAHAVVWTRLSGTPVKMGELHVTESESRFVYELPFLDSGLPGLGLVLSPQIYAELEDASLLLHAGDFVSEKFYRELSKKYNLIAVCGNMDPFQLREQLPQKRIIQIEDLKLGLIHGRGAPSELKSLVIREFKEKRPDIIVFGHSHFALKEKDLKTGIFLFNPGSPTDTIYAPYKSFGIIKVNRKEFSFEIRKI